MVFTLIERLTNSGASVVSILSDHEKPLIVLKDGKKRVITYEDTPFTEQATLNLTTINRTLHGHWYDLDMPPEQWTALNERMTERAMEDHKKPFRVDLTARSLHRVFNDEDWNAGGRFYGGWWQYVPREFRKHITIDDKRTAEVDYSGMHARMLYAEVGIEKEGDLYDLGLPGIDRNLVKKTFVSMINSKKGLRKPRNYNEDETGMSWSRFKELIMEAHAPLARYFYTDQGKRLQARDAKIAEQVMLRFASSGYPCLPVHDSFIVHHELVDELKGVMLDVFSSNIGHDVGVKTKEGLELDVKIHQSSTWDANIENILSNMNDYERRLQAWYAYMGN